MHAQDVEVEEVEEVEEAPEVEAQEVKEVQKTQEGGLAIGKWSRLSNRNRKQS